MFELIAYAEPTWLDAKTDHRMWDQLARAYGGTSMVWGEHYPPPTQGALVLVDQRGKVSLSEFVHPPHCTYVFGRTGMNRMLEEVAHDHSIRIDTPNPISLFGVSAAAIVLADREAKLP